MDISRRETLRFVDSTVILVITQSFGLLIGFVVSVLVSRLLGPEGKGIFSLLFGLATILFGISNLGLGYASQYFISRKPETFRAHFGNVLVFPLIAAVLVITSFCMTFPFWQPRLEGLSLTDLLPVFVMLPLMLIYEACCQLLVVLKRIGKRSVAVMSQGGVSLLSAIALLVGGASAVGVSFSYVFGWLLGGILAFLFVIRTGGFPSRPTLTLLRETVNYSAGIWFAGLVKGLFTRADFLFLYSLRSAAEAGIYSVAAALTSGIIITMHAVLTMFYPRTSAMTTDEANRTTPFYYRQMQIVMFAAALVTLVASHPMLLVFGRAFSGGAVPMIALIVAMAVGGLNGILYHHLLGRGKARMMSVITMTTLLQSVLLNSMLVPKFGMIGAAIATLGALIGENLILTVIFCSLSGFSVRSLYAFRRDDFRILVHEASAAMARLRAVPINRKLRK